MYQDSISIIENKIAYVANRKKEEYTKGITSHCTTNEELDFIDEKYSYCIAILRQLKMEFESNE